MGHFSFYKDRSSGRTSLFHTGTTEVVVADKATESVGSIVFPWDVVVWAILIGAGEPRTLLWP